MKPITITIQRSTAVEQAKVIIGKREGSVESIEVLDRLLELITEQDAVFLRDGMGPVSLERMRSLRNHNFDPR